MSMSDLEKLMKRGVRTGTLVVFSVGGSKGESRLIEILKESKYEYESFEIIKGRPEQNKYQLDKTNRRIR